MSLSPVMKQIEDHMCNENLDKEWIARALLELNTRIEVIERKQEDMDSRISGISSGLSSVANGFAPRC